MEEINIKSSTIEKRLNEIILDKTIEPALDEIWLNIADSLIGRRLNNQLKILEKQKLAGNGEQQRVGMLVND